MRSIFSKVHSDIVKLGFVSFLTDVSSEAIFSVFSIFFITIAGASAALLGIVEGIADFSASSLDYVSGWLSDKFGKRKIFAAAGYGFSALAKIFLVAANSVAALSLFRVIERLGKSFRGPPRDAWISDVAGQETRGYSFGLHKAMDKAGAVVGPLLAYVLLNQLGQNIGTFRTLFIAAAVVALVAVAVLALMKDRPAEPRQMQSMFGTWTALSSGFKSYLAAAGIFSLAYFSFGFLLLKAYALGFSVKDIVLLYALFNLSFVLISAPVGTLGDVIGRRRVIALGYAVYTLMSVGFIFASAKWQIVVLFVVFGVFYGIDEAQSKAFIADLEKERRGSAIGLYNFLTGLVYLPASIIAGLLWTANPAYAFAFSAIVAVIALLSFLWPSLSQDTRRAIVLCSCFLALAAVQDAMVASSVPTNTEKSGLEQIIPATPATEIIRGDAAKKQVIFTFDGGGSDISINAILETLGKHGVKGTFFLTGKFVEAYPDIVRKIAQAGHEIFNHTYDHPYLTQIPNDEIIQELAGMDRALESVTGISAKPYFRPPYGDIDQRVRVVAAAAGYQSVYWTNDAGDWEEPNGMTAAEVKDRILGALAPGNIYLMHIGDSITGTILDEIFNSIESKGYKIVSLTQGL